MMQINVEMISHFLSLVTAPWLNAQPPGYLEIRAIGEKSLKVARFSIHELPLATDFVCKLNSMCQNVYACINPSTLSPVSENSGSKDINILRAHFAFADCDAKGSAEQLPKLAPPYDFRVITGRTPFLRCHYYWQLEPFLNDLRVWSQLQKEIARTFNADPVICNPSRIMRIPGTITYPSKKKLEQGYESELALIDLEK